MVVSGCVPAEPDSVSPGAGQGKRRGGKGQGGRVPQEPERKVSSRPDRIGRLSGRFIFPSRRGYDESVYTEVRGENHGDAQRDGIQEGLICVLTCVEPCKTYEIHRNRQEKLLQLRLRLRKCKFLYHYWIDPQFGFMSARIQTWFPFSRWPRSILPWCAEPSRPSPAAT